ncbi:DUF397 domain-containing protein [Streptomyces sp. NPDC102395]|uniref:DUF397 domain-containing protein n=1 Tax=Streptomyces sp. NPDC102395 TaxID=3366168 RepID=UPI003828F7A3
MDTQPQPAGTWCKSSYSLNEDSFCVEVADFGAIGVRDSKVLQGPVLHFGRADWAGFISALKDERINR